MENIKELLEGVDVETMKELRAISEAEMFDIAGEKQIKEEASTEDMYRDTVLEYATLYNRADFYEKVKALGLPRSSKLVRAAEPLLKD